MMKKTGKEVSGKYSLGKYVSGRRLILYLTAVLMILSMCFLAPFTMTVRADSPTDEIEHFRITVDVQEDASLKMTYHIDWKVLDDDEYGPLEWVDIGMPNANHSDVTALGSSIDHIKDNGRSLAIYLDRSYYEGEVASFEFSFTQDHMYQIDRFVQGETVFAFTPALTHLLFLLTARLLKARIRAGTMILMMIPMTMSMMTRIVMMTVTSCIRSLAQWSVLALSFWDRVCSLQDLPNGPPKDSASAVPQKVRNTAKRLPVQRLNTMKTAPAAEPAVKRARTTVPTADAA